MAREGHAIEVWRDGGLSRRGEGLGLGPVLKVGSGEGGHSIQGPGRTGRGGGVARRQPWVWDAGEGGKTQRGRRGGEGEGGQRVGRVGRDGRGARARGLET